MADPSRLNPFPGPQPYRSEDRARFFGREQAISRLFNHIIAHPCTILFGPSGCGKSSLMQAGVIPLLDERHDFRVVRVDGWPDGRPPLAWVSAAVAEETGLPPPAESEGAPASAGAGDVLRQTIQIAYRRSDRPLLIYLDQLEQLFYPNRSPGEADDLFRSLSRLARSPMRGLQLVLS